MSTRVQQGGRTVALVDVTQALGNARANTDPTNQAIGVSSSGPGTQRSTGQTASNAGGQRYPWVRRAAALMGTRGNVGRHRPFSGRSRRTDSNSDSIAVNINGSIADDGSMAAAGSGDGNELGNSNYDEYVTRSGRRAATSGRPESADFLIFSLGFAAVVSLVFMVGDLLNSRTPKAVTITLFVLSTSYCGVLMKRQRPVYDPENEGLPRDQMRVAAVAAAVATARAGTGAGGRRQRQPSPTILDQETRHRLLDYFVLRPPEAENKSRIRSGSGIIGGDGVSGDIDSGDIDSGGKTSDYDKDVRFTKGSNEGEDEVCATGVEGRDGPGTWGPPLAAPASPLRDPPFSSSPPSPYVSPSVGTRHRSGSGSSERERQDGGDDGRPEVDERLRTEGGSEQEAQGHQAEPSGLESIAAGETFGRFKNACSAVKTKHDEHQEESPSSEVELVISREEIIPQTTKHAALDGKAKGMEDEGEDWSAATVLGRGRGGSGEWSTAGACIVCFGDYTYGEELCRLPCRHLYHAKCIDEWFDGPNRGWCPLCKTEIVAVADATDENADTNGSSSSSSGSSDTETERSGNASVNAVGNTNNSVEDTPHANISGDDAV